MNTTQVKQNITKDSLFKDFQHFVDSNKVLLKQSKHFNDSEITLSDNAQTNPIQDQDSLLAISQAFSMKTVSLLKTFQWANGIALIPTIATLLERGVISYIQERRRVSFNELTSQFDVPTSCYGVFWGALNLIGLVGWLKSDGFDTHANFELTEAGYIAFTLILSNKEAFTLSMKHITSLQELGKYVRSTSSHQIDSLEELIDFPFDITGLDASYQVSRVVKHLNTYLNGYVLGPVLVALGMPKFIQKDLFIVPETDSILDAFSKEADTVVDIDTFSRKHRLNQSVLIEIAALLSKAGLGKLEGNALSFNDAQNTILKIAPFFSGLPGSYLKSFANLDTILFVNPDPFIIDTDQHVDRVMNVFASSGAGSGPAAQSICDHVLGDIFNRPLETQPVGIADMGCGDGIAISRLAQYVIKHTKRGQHLAEYPLFIMGADFSEESLSRTRETFKQFDDQTHVNTIVIHADVSNPDLYQKHLLQQKITIVDPISKQKRLLNLNDFVHTFMFLVHNRRLSIDAEQAKDILNNYTDKIDLATFCNLFEPFALEELPKTKAELKKYVYSQCKTAYPGNKYLAEGFLVAADLIVFMKKWKQYTRHGFLSLDSHNSWNVSMEEVIPENTNQWMAVEMSAHPLIWGMHYVSQQYMVSLQEYTMCMILAGFMPENNRLYRDLFPGLATIDQDPKYKFFSLGLFKPY